ncbi:ribonuclease HIII, partial [Mycoplasma nasistruthionis]
MNFFDDIKKFDLSQKEVIGVDETGVGDFFTPLVACAVYLPNQLIDQVRLLGVRDSKKLTDKKIIQIANQLIDIVPFSSYVMTQNGYNTLSKNYNANELKFFTHASALANLHKFKPESHKANLIIIDKYSTTNSILNYHQKIFQFNNWSKLQELNLDTLLINKAEDV